MSSRFVDTMLGKVSHLKKAGCPRQAADILLDLCQCSPDQQAVAHFRESWIREAVAESLDMMNRDALDRAATLLLDLPVVENEAGNLRSCLDNVLVKQVLLDQRAQCMADAVQLGRMDLLPPAAGEPIAEQTLLRIARLYLAQAYWTTAGMLCNYLADRGYHSAQLLDLQGQVRRHFGEPQPRQTAGGKGHLLIKAWGTGFWSEIDNLIGNLLLAEITGRTPVVDWGSNFLFSDEPDIGFEQFFAPLNDCHTPQLATPGHSFFPPKWKRENLMLPEFGKAAGPWSRLSPLGFLNRQEDVIVSDYFVAVNELAPWIPPGHDLFGKNIEQIYRSLFRRYLVLQPEIRDEVDRFWSTHLQEGPFLAVHLRGSDKITEDTNLSVINQLYPAAIEKFLASMPGARLFLITDSTPMLDRFAQLYGNRLVVPPGSRTSTDQGVHYQHCASKRRLGVEVLRDALLASRCDAFIGNGLSSVSAAVSYLKEWEPGRCRLLGATSLHMRRLTYYCDAGR